MNFDFIDTHTHVHFRAFKDDMDEVIKRSLAEGIGMVTVGTQSTTSKNGIKLAERCDGVWATVGLHPNHLHKQEFTDTNETVKTRAETFDAEYYKNLAKHPKVVAIGEFGLDYYRIPKTQDRERVVQDQKVSCRAQLKAASDINKPVVIHCRDAHRDQFELLKEEIERDGLKKRGVIHSFTGTKKDADRYREIDFYLGLNGILTFSDELQKVIKSVPLEQIVVETDAPYLTPPPYRGKRNEPRYVKYIAKKLAEIKNVSVETVAEVTTKNAMNLFGL